MLGENGAGKTTLMRIAYGLLKADAGSVQLDGRSVDIASPAVAMRNGIAMVQQHFSLIPAMTAVENFALGKRGLFIQSREAKRLQEFATQLGLSFAPDARANTLTAAEQQQLEIAKALGRECSVLILDEPTAVLTPLHAASLLRWLREFADQGRSAVLITHKLRDAVAVADDITVLRHGRSVLTSRATDATESDLLGAMLGTRPTPAAPQRRAFAVTTIDVQPVASLASVTATDRREQLLEISLDVAPGEILGVAGLDGSGHRLLLRVLAGRRAATRGSVVLPTKIAFIPEDRQREALATDLPLRDNIALRGAGTRRGWMRWRYWSARTRKLLKEFDVRAGTPGAERGAEGDELFPANALSGGNQQKLVLARELSDQPELIVAENPTRGLDVQAAAGISTRLRAARDNGGAVVFYSSDIDELIAECDRVLVAYFGRVRLVEKSREAIGRALVGAA